MTGDLRIAEINYDNIVDNYIKFLRDQEEFKDLDFEASAIRRIIALLAYDLHYSAYYANASFKEHFLDSAILRSSVVSHAKKYGYVPKSIRASNAIVDVRLENGTNLLNRTIQLPKGTVFKGKLKDRTETFDFVTTQTYQIFANNLDLTFENVELVQGNYTSFDVQIDKFNSNAFVELPDTDIDVRYLEVYVQEGSDNSRFERYTNAREQVTLSDDSVYWLEEGPNGRFQIHFGDGIIGKEVDNGKVVRLVYIKTRGVDGNNASEFTYSTSNSQFNNFLSSNFSSIEVITLSRSLGGDRRETIQDIKFRAPRYKGSGTNAWRTQDYEEIILERFSEISSVRVWDASYLDDPSGQIGKIFISAIPENASFFTQDRKNAIMNELQSEVAGANKCFEFVDPKFIYPKLNIKANLKDKISNSSPEFIRALITQQILNYNELELQRFTSDLELSDLNCLISGVDDAIDNIIMDIDLQTRMTPCLNQSVGYTSTLNNSIFPESIYSNIFQINSVRGEVIDLGDGKLYFKREDDNKQTEIGTVNYANGNIELFPINVTKGAESTADIRISAKARNENIRSSEENVLRIEEDCINIAVFENVQARRAKYE